MAKRDDFVYIPKPGTLIKEEMEFYGYLQKDLSKRLDITEKHLSNVINGEASIGPKLAESLEMVFGASKRFWLNLQLDYDLAKEELEIKNVVDSVCENISYNDIVKNGWIVKEDNSKKYKAEVVKKFFGVSNLLKLNNVYGNEIEAFFRKHGSNNFNEYNAYAWIRRLESKGLEVEVKDFDKKELELWAGTFSDLTQYTPDEIQDELKSQLAEMGIALVFVEQLPNTGICGATLYKNNKIIVGLSLRGKREDGFWFTLAHEIAHVLKHYKKENISFESDKNIEDDADLMAQNLVLSEKIYFDFLRKYNVISERNIVEFCDKNQIQPSILIGRLMYDGKLDYKNNMDKFRRKFEIKNGQIMPC